MALTKQSVPVNFGNGLDTKTDPNQVQVGKFLTLTNSVFTKGGALTKRNGFAQITTLPNDLETTLTTLGGNLVATGSDLYFYNEDNNSWTDSGTIQPVNLSTLPVVRTSTSQTSPDATIAPSGLACIAYVDSGAVYYQVSDSSTGQQLVNRTLLAAAGACPRTFVLPQYFIITFLATVGGGTHLQYVAIPLVNPTAPTAIADLSTTLVDLNAGYDGYVAQGQLYIAWSDTGTVIKLTYITGTLVVASPKIISGYYAPVISVTADLTTNTPVIWVSFWQTGGGFWYTTAYSSLPAVILPVTATLLPATETIVTMTSVAKDNVLSLFYEVPNTFASPYPESGVRTDYIRYVTMTIGGVAGGPALPILRSVGLGSKAFIDAANGNIYMLAAYGDKAQSDAAQDSNQPTYFLIDSNGNIYMRLAYSNGGGYSASQSLPSVSFLNNQYIIAYLYADFLTTVNKGTNTPTGTPANAIYTQTGINLAKFSINTSGQYSSEIAGALHLTGGQLWEYDGVKPVEHGFQVWPENIQVATSGSGGSVGAGTYYYQFTYEWTDAAGNLHRSAPSIPISVTTTGSTSTNTLYVPTLRLTYKTLPNPVRIVGYRWSVAQQVYYQFTSVTSPIINNPLVDFITITDTKSDAQILGNAILYTTGGVVENIAAPASVATALFKNRLFLVDAEDRNLIWYSKQVIEAVPVEMSDLFTLYVAPTTGAQGSTGPVTALSAMDDKLIIFKKDAIYYLTGTGPDNTGASNDFSDPVYITASVGCANPASIVLMPQGLMFQSDKGIWLLGRDLSTQYIGAAVESYNSQTVESAQAIPGTNQVRFILGDNITLMYDYYYSQWGTFTNIRAVSATLYQGMHTYLNAYGQVFQETPGTWLDGSTPVLMSLTTSWMNVAGIRGYERFYYFLMLGTYYTPFKLNVQLAYDYGAPEYAIVVTPDNQTPNWGGDAQWGSGQAWGGIGNSFQARIFPQKQKCQTFQITMTEQYDSSFGQPAGQGLSLSGFNFVIGAKKGYSPQRASRSFG